MRHKIVQTEVIDYHLSDQNNILCVLKGSIPKLPSRIKESRSFKNYCKYSFINELNEVPLTVIDSVDGAVFLWEKLFCGVSDSHASIKKRLKGYSTPWMTEKLYEIRRDRDYHLRKAHKTISKYQ